MVAYSFKASFAAPIISGLKRQTIRADRKRHARPGEELQLYTGMRTRQCRLLRRAECVSVRPIEIDVQPLLIATIFIEGVPIDDLNEFARDDGFEDLADMHKFWRDNHQPGQFTGVIISWN
jgi:uncharacterized protein YqfB (UPF0267 family)